VAAAKAALKGPWGKLSVVERCNMLDAVVNEINRRFDDFLQAEIADTGKPRTWPRTSTSRAARPTSRSSPTPSRTSDRVVRDAHARRQDRPQLRRAHPARRDRRDLPVEPAAAADDLEVGPALACGNTVVVKPSEATPSTATLLGEVMNKVGVPKGVYNVCTASAPDSAGAFLTAHPGVNGITFTGETKHRHRHHEGGADGIRPVSLELGGKNAALVFADCDFDNAVATITRSCFENCGQVCLGTERVYVQRPIFDKFVAALKEKAEQR
jgi:aminomuconate-semialdehyde/2-hydroxymuconate-6-semialdehyde dehydrogenase